MSRKLLDVPGSTAELRQARVFISYARLDTELVEPVVKALADRGVKILRDVEDLLPTEKWRARLVGMISEADAALFFISPNFADSEVCAWEAQTAHSLAKRLVPIRIDDVAAAGLPEILSELNWLLTLPLQRSGF